MTAQTIPSMRTEGSWANSLVLMIFVRIVPDTSTDDHGTGEFHACGEQHGLFHCEGPRGRGCCKGIYDIVSTCLSISMLTSEVGGGDLTNVLSVQESKDSTDSKKIVKLMEDRYGVRLLIGFNCL